jgi:hypothetical protein
MAASVSAKRKAPTGGGKLSCIRIEIEGNGFKVCKEFTPKMGKFGPIYDGGKPSDCMVFTEPGACLTYIEQCLPKSEHMAHEKAEGKHEKY